MIIAIGLDAVDIPRVERMIAENRDRVLARLFSDEESAYAMARPKPAQHLAARLAAKEAVFKALAGNELARTVGWRDIEVANGADGAPSVRLLGRAQIRAHELGVERVHLSLTHAEGLAIAVVVLER